MRLGNLAGMLQRQVEGVRIMDESVLGGLC